MAGIAESKEALGLGDVLDNLRAQGFGGGEALFGAEALGEVEAERGLFG